MSTNPTRATQPAVADGHPLQGGQVVGHEGRLEKKVLGWVAGDGQLGEGGQIGPVLLGPGQRTR